MQCMREIHRELSLSRGTPLAAFGMKRAAEEEEAEKAGAKALEKYEVGDILGEGSFACVRLVTRKTDGLKLAMKLIDGDGMSEEEVERERSILSLLGMHRHIVSLVEHFELPEGAVFVMELADGGEVFERICERGAYSEADAASVVRQVALALAFIHSLGVAHRDLKPENLLLTSNDEVKLADFGLAGRCGADSPPLHQVCGTVTYLAPEMLAADEPGGAPYGVPVDMFALGCVMFALLGGYVCFDPTSSGSDEDVMKRIECGDWGFDAFPDAWTAVSTSAKDLIRALLEPDPSKRLTADGVLQSKWVSGEGAAEDPLPGSDAQMRRFNEGRRVWRAAVNAAALFLHAPLAAAHGASSPAAAQAASSSATAASDETKAVAAAATRKLPPMVQAELRSAFALFDLDGDGHIDADEMRHAVRSLGASGRDAARVLANADADGDGRVSFDEFCALVRPVYDDSGAALRAAFALFDGDGSGYIDRSELSKMLRRLGFEWQGAHVFEAADVDGDGQVSYDEFVAVFGKAAAAKGKTAGMGKRGRAAAGGGGKKTKTAGGGGASA